MSDEPHMIAPALTALAGLEQSLPAAGDEREHAEYVRRVFTSAAQAATREGRFVPGFTTYSPRLRSVVCDVVRRAQEDLVEALVLQRSALTAALSRIEAFDRALTHDLDAGRIPADEAARRRTEHHALVRTITEALEGRA